jgi:hypothetical protein
MEDVKRLPAVDGRWAKHARGYQTPTRYAQALTHKMAIWRARQKKAPCVLVFEDDVVFAPDLREKLAEITLPEDWGIFFLGCQHLERPELAGPGLVRCHKTWDMHAYAVNAKFYTQVMRILTATKANPAQGALTCDTELQKIQKELPCYAAWPNLAWQPLEESDAATGWMNDNYLLTGRQSKFTHLVAGLDEEMAQLTGRAAVAAPYGSRWLNWSPPHGASGMGDRMRSLAGMMAVAQAKGQTLRVLWESHPACPAKHDAVLEPNGYVVVDNLREWERLTQGQPCETQIGQSLTMGQIFSHLTSGGGTIAPGETAETMEARWCRMVRKFRIKREILLCADEIQHGWGIGRLLGIHVRRTDILKDPRKGINVANEEGYDAALFRLAEEYCDGGQVEGFFLATDNPTSAAQWRQKLRALDRPVFETAKRWNVHQMRQSSLEDAMLDLNLLSRCDFIIGSTYSSFAVLAAEMGGIQYKIAEPNFAII